MKLGGLGAPGESVVREFLKDVAVDSRKVYNSGLGLMEGLKEGQPTRLLCPQFQTRTLAASFFRAPMREPNLFRARAVQLREQNLSSEITIGARVAGRGRGIESGGGHNGRSQQRKSEYDDSYNRFNHFQKPPRFKVESLCRLAYRYRRRVLNVKLRFSGIRTDRWRLLKVGSLSRRCAGVVHTRGSSPLASPGQ
jgi:hypothetical protein